MSSHRTFSSVRGWNNSTPPRPSRKISQQQFAKEFSSYFSDLRRKDYFLFFVTYTLSKKEIYSYQSSNKANDIKSLDPSGALKIFDLLYTRTCSQLLGNNWRRKRAYLPIVLACVDLPHTRYKKEVTSIPDVTPHIHAIYAVHPNTLTQFDALTEHDKQAELMSRTDRRLLTVDIKPITRGVLEDVSTYLTKALRYYPEDEIDQNMWSVHPDQRP